MQKKFYDTPYALYTQAIKNLHIPVRLDQSPSPSHGFLVFFYWYCTKIPSFFWRHNLAKWNTKKTLFRHRIIVPFTIVFDAGECHSCISLWTPAEKTANIRRAPRCCRSATSNIAQIKHFWNTFRPQILFFLVNSQHFSRLPKRNQSARKKSSTFGFDFRQFLPIITRG